MIKERFCVGDVVDIVPHEDVRNNYSISKHVWEAERALNPRIIRRVCPDYYEIVRSSGRPSYCWPPDAFVPHEEPARVEVGDLL